MKDLKVGERVQILIDDEIFDATVYDISRRETEREESISYSLNIINTDWSVSLHRITEKKSNVF